MGSLVVAILGLVVGPVLSSVGPASRAWREAMGGLSLTLVGGLCLLHLAPHALEHGGLVALLAGLAGAALPMLAHRAGDRNARIWYSVALALLAVHAATDGALLALANADLGSTLALAVAAHRLPVGLAVFDAAREAPRIGWMAIGLLVLATGLGYGAGASVAHALPDTLHGAFEGLIAGALLHTVVMQHPSADAHAGHAHAHHDAGHAHRDAGHAHHDAGHAHHDHAHHDHASYAHHDAGHAHHDHAHGDPASGHADHHHDHTGCSHHGHAHGDSHDPGRSRPGFAEPIGALVGLAALAAFTLFAGGGALHHVEETARTFVALTLDSAPALLLGFVLAGLLSSFLDPAGATWLARGGRFGQALRGVGFGLPLPVCSCGVVPMYASLIRKGVPTAAALAFLVATPELGLDAVLLSIPLLGVPMTVARVVAAFVAALVVALLVGKAVSSAPLSAVASEPVARSVSERLRGGLRYGLAELVDHTLPWVLVGLMAAALAEPLLDHDLLLALPAAVQVPLAALVGVPIYVCASGATPLAAMAVHKGLSGGAALAFLIAGPATNVTTFGVLAGLHGRALALRFGLALFVMAVAMGWAADLVGVASPDLLHAPGAVEESPRPFAWAATLALVVLALGSLFRQGMQGIVGQITNPIHAH